MSAGGVPYTGIKMTTIIVKRGKPRKAKKPKRAIRSFVTVVNNGAAAAIETRRPGAMTIAGLLANQQKDQDSDQG